MFRLRATSLQCNPHLSVINDAGQLSNDAGMILPIEFTNRIHLKNLIRNTIFFNDERKFAKISFVDLFEFTLMLRIAGYCTDSAANTWRQDPAIRTALGECGVASQASISRFIASLTQDNLVEIQNLLLKLADVVLKDPSRTEMILDIDSTHSDTFGHQEHATYNGHYSANGYHPLLVFDDATGLLLGAQLRPGNVYTSSDADTFIAPILDHLKALRPDMNITVRGDSGFAKPEFYAACAKRSVKFIVRLKKNNRINELTTTATQATEMTTDFQSEGHELDYQVKTWANNYRVIVHSESKAESFLWDDHTWLVTNDTKIPCETLITRYRQRGRVEDLIKELKAGFAFDKTDSHSFTMNAARALISAVAYNIVQLFKLILIPFDARKTIATLRFELLHVAGKITHHAHRIVLHLASSQVFSGFIGNVLNDILQM